MLRVGFPEGEAQSSRWSACQHPKILSRMLSRCSFPRGLRRDRWPPSQVVAVSDLALCLLLSGWGFLAPLSPAHLSVSQTLWLSHWVMSLPVERN